MTRLRKFDVFDRVFTDYGWRTLLMAVLTLAGNIVYFSYLIWMAVAYTSPWYAALAGFYAWLVIIRGTVIFADRVAEKRKKDSASAARNRCVIALICGVAMITAGCAVSSPVIQMAVGNYPQSGGVSNLSMLEAGASLWQLVVVLGAAVSTAILAVGACSVIRNALELKKYPKQKE